MNNSSDVSPVYLGYEKNDCCCIWGDKNQIDAKRKRSNDSWNIKKEQAGAELCQALDKMGLAKPSLPRKKLSTSFKTWMSSSIYQNI